MPPLRETFSDLEVRGVHGLGEGAREWAHGRVIDPSRWTLLEGFVGPDLVVLGSERVEPTLLCGAVNPHGCAQSAPRRYPRTLEDIA